MAVTPINVGSDQFADFYAAYNASIESLAAAAVRNGVDFELRNYLGAVLQTLQLNNTPDQNLSDFGFSISGTNPNFLLDNTGGSYVYQNETYAIAASSTAIATPNATFDRFDTVYVDGTATVLIQAGTAGLSPQAPSVTGLVLGYVYVYANGATDPSFEPAGDILATNITGNTPLWNGAHYVGKDLISQFDGLNGYKLVKSNYGTAFGVQRVTTTPVTLTGSQTTIFVDTNVARNITLPTNPTNGQILFVYDHDGLAGTNNITLTAGAGTTIKGAATFVIDANFGVAILSFDASDNEWEVAYMLNATATYEITSPNSDTTLVTTYIDGDVICRTGLTTLTLPATPQNGYRRFIKNRTGSNITIARNAKNIDGSATNLVLPDFANVRLIYSSVTGDWNIG